MNTKQVADMFQACDSGTLSQEEAVKVIVDLSAKEMAAAKVRTAELEAGLAEIHSEIGYYLEHDKKLLEKIAALKGGE